MYTLAQTVPLKFSEPSFWTPNILMIISYLIYRMLIGPWPHRLEELTPKLKELTPKLKDLTPGLEDLILGSQDLTPRLRAFR